MITFVCTGHVDFGKSTLCGHLLYKSGYVSEHDLNELRQKAKVNKMTGWEYAYVLDIYDEERSHGKTNDFNVVEFKYQGKDYRLIDTPGHHIYIRQLIEGLNSYSPEQTVGCLLVSLANGEYEAGMGNGQTKQDLLLMRAVGINSLIVALNKVDLVPEDSERFSKIKNELETYVKRLGFAHVEYQAISGYHGTGLDALMDKITVMASKLPEPQILSEPTRSESRVVRLKLLYDDNCNIIFSPSLQLIAHVGKQEITATVGDRLYEFDPKTKNKGKKLIFAKSGQTILTRLHGDFYASIGQRLLIRKDNHTLGFGIVCG